MKVGDHISAPHIGVSGFVRTIFDVDGDEVLECEHPDQIIVEMDAPAPDGNTWARVSIGVATKIRVTRPN